METVLARANNRHPVPLDQKATILDDAVGRIDRETLEQIAQSHGITKRTLNTWLMGLDGYTELRQAVIDSQLAEAMEAIDTADDTFPLARAREMFRSRSWMAERRDSRYAAKQEVQSTRIQVVIVRADDGSILCGEGKADAV